METVKYIEVKKYLGVWYEQARKPACFEKNMLDAKAEYTQNLDAQGKIESITVTNSAHLYTSDGDIKQTVGTAWIDSKTNAKLKVQFFWPFKGDYWILELDDTYEYVLVGEPSRTYMWILTREKKIDNKTKPKIEALLKLAREKHGYDTSDVLKNYEKIKI